MPNHRAPNIVAIGLISILVGGGSARAQPAEEEGPVDPWPGETDSGPGDPAGAPADAEAPPPSGADGDAPRVSGQETDGAAQPGPLVEPRTDDPPPGRQTEKLSMPVMFNAATADLLPAGVIMSSGGVDTGGGISSDLRIGLGDVAEFGIGSTDLIRVGRDCDADAKNCDFDSVRWYPLALFKMGVAEDRLFRQQPALALGFRKSFERNHDARSTRIAELYLVASKSLGPSARLHLGGVFWDASIKHGDDERLFHDEGIGKQLRPFGGIELEPLPRSKLMLELIWVPEFHLAPDGGADDIKLRPMFAWGVRYELNDWAMIESGVRIPDIENINLLDAQIFGQLKFVSRRFSRFLEGID